MPQNKPNLLNIGSYYDWTVTDTTNAVGESAAVRRQICHSLSTEREHDPRCVFFRRASEENFNRPDPKPTKFVNVGKQVMQGNHCVAVARSSTFARRIAAALIFYTPGGIGY